MLAVSVENFLNFNVTHTIFTDVEKKVITKQTKTKTTENFWLPQSQRIHKQNGIPEKTLGGVLVLLTEMAAKTFNFNLIV